MARNEEMERRCLNWARWQEGAGQGGLGYSSVFHGATGGYRTSVVPTLDVEAEQTDRAIRTLGSPLRETVHIYYLDTGTMEERCTRLQISRATIYTRIDRAHEVIAAWLRELEARAKHEAERVQLLTRLQK